MGIAGLIAVIAIVKGFGIDYRVAVFGAVIMLVLMAMLVVFAKLAAKRESVFHWPAIIFTWFALILIIATAIALFTSVFWGRPLELRYKGPSSSIDTPLPQGGRNVFRYLFENFPSVPSFPVVQNEKPFAFCSLHDILRDRSDSHGRKS